MSKVLFVIDTLDTGGAERSILELTRQFKDIKASVCILFESKNDLKAEFTNQNIPVHELQLSKHDKLWLFKGLRKVRSVLANVQPQIIHAHLYRSELLMRLAKPSHSILVGAFVNDSYSKERYDALSLMGKLKLYAYQLTDRITARKSNYFTSISNTITASNCKKLGIPFSKVTTIYRGRTVTTFQSGKSLQAPHQKGYRFLTVGRLLKRKGYMELIDAARMLKEKQQNFHLQIAGDGADADFIHSYAAALVQDGTIEFLGTRNDVPQLLRDCDCFIMASHYEGQGGALVEAMLSSKPIIASDIPVFREQVVHNISATLFELKNAKALCTQMEWMMENKEAALKLGIAAHKVAVERFDIQKIAVAYEEFYTTILKEQHS